MGGLSVANEDVIAWDGASFAMVMDGSDVGLAGLTLDAFAVLPANQLLLSFTSAASIPGIAGTVDDSDIVMFAASSLGANTSGAFSLHFDGSDVGLTTNAEDVDAIDMLANGHLLLSTTGSVSVPGVSAAEQDVLEFTPSSLGAATTGTWAWYFDGSDVGLAASAEDVDALAVRASGELRLSTTGSFAVPGIAGANEDAFTFTPASLGATTAGSYSTTLAFDGSLFGLSANDISGLDAP